MREEGLRGWLASDDGVGEEMSDGEAGRTGESGREAGAEGEGEEENGLGGEAESMPGGRMRVVGKDWEL